MLNRAFAASALPMAMLFGATDAHADDIGLTTPQAVTADAICQHSVTAPGCTGTVTVKRNGIPEKPPVSHAAAAPAAPPLPTCYYKLAFTYSTSEAVQSSGGPSEMVVQEEICPPGGDPVGPPLLFTPVAPAAPAVSIKALVDQATKSMDLPLPQASLSPAARSTQFVGVPLWAWTASSAWVPKSVTLSAGGVSLTMTAAPVFTVWSMGDGGSVTCRGPGAPYPAARVPKPPEKSPDCGYVYSGPSTSQPGGAFPVSVTTHWKAAWSTTSGLSGQEPDLTASSSLRLRVSEIQALVTGVRP